MKPNITKHNAKDLVQYGANKPNRTCINVTCI